MPANDFRPRLLAPDDHLLAGVLGVVSFNAVLLAAFVALSPPPPEPEIAAFDWTPVDSFVVPVPVEPTIAPTPAKAPTVRPSGPAVAARPTPTHAPGTPPPSALIALISGNGPGVTRGIVPDGPIQLAAASRGFDPSAPADGPRHVDTRLPNLRIAETPRIGPPGGPPVEVHVDAPRGPTGRPLEVGDQRPDDAPQGIPAVVRRHLGELTYCYEDALRRDPHLAGRVDLHWKIVAGRVTAVETTSNATEDVAFAQCLERKVRRWVFPAEVTVEVEWPFVFREG